MRIQTYKRCVYYLKSTGTCVVIVGSCWLLYQLRQTLVSLRTGINTNVLNLEHTQAQYIYIDNPRFKDAFKFQGKEHLDTVPMKQSFAFGYVLKKWWKSINRNLAYRLLYMAQHGDKTERFKSIYSLNRFHYLKDWHYSYMAQMIDAKTAIVLARMPNVDLRFFLKPPYYHIDHSLFDVIEELHSLLLHLNTVSNNTHPCLMQFLNKKFGDTHRDGLIFDHDLTSMGLAAPPTIVWDHELLKSCVQAICHHSSLEHYSKDIIDAGGLQILMMVQKLLRENIDISILLAKTLSNISLHSEYLEHIFQSGWIGILTKWSQDKDVRLSAPAGRTLANLDIDENAQVKYPRRVYLLHPLHRMKSSPKLDVIFLHGLLGGVFVTWRQRDHGTTSPGFVETQMKRDSLDPYTAIIDEHSQEFLDDLAWDFRLREWNKVGRDFEIILDDCPENTNCDACGPYFCKNDDECMMKLEHDQTYKTKCWPKDWLPDDVPFLRILGINYDTNLSLWTPLCPIDSIKSTLAERSDEYLTKLLMAGVGKRPITWVCHSMGGLLVKKMLVEEWKNGDKHSICKNTRGIIFYSTPHRGSRVAALTQTTQMLVWPSVEVQELREESPQLLALHKEFLAMLKDFPVEVVSFSETKPTLVTSLKFPFQFVSTSSADPGVGEFFEIPQDHLSICKPANRQSFLYQKLLHVLRHQVINRTRTKSVQPTMNFSSVSNNVP